MADQLRQGPATFALDTAGTVGSSDVPTIGAPSAQPGAIAPGLTTQAPGVSDADGRTFRAITDLASGVLAPKIREASQQQFMTGVQQAMTGESLDEIIKEKPWYTDIFAPSAALAGARTYTAQRSIAEWGGKMQEQMPILAKQGPEALQKAATGALQGFLTGDAGADAMITSAVVEQMAPLFKQHAKEHYVFVQKQASEAQIGAWEGLGKVYQGFAASEASGKGTVSPADRDAAKARFLGAITPFADQSDESFERNVSAFLAGTASAGNFQVVKLFKENGLYDKLPPDKRAVLDAHLRSAGREALNKATPQFAMDMAVLVNDMTQDPRRIPERVAALNAKAAALTGVTEAELIPPQTVDNMIGGVMRAQRAELDARAAKAQTAGEKELEKLQAVALAQTMIGQDAGKIDGCLKVGLCTEQAAETAGTLMYQAAQDPAAKAKVLNARTLSAFEPVKAQFVATMRSPEYQAGIGQMAQVYQGLADDVKPHYFDEHERALMDRFNTMVRAGTPPNAAWVMTKASPSVVPYLIPKETKDAVSKAIRAEAESQNEGAILHINTVDDASLRTIEAMTMRTLKLDHSNNPLDVAVKRAYSQARANGLDLQGKHAVLNANPKDPPLFRMVGEGQVATADAFEELMAERAKAQGVSLDNYEAVRVPDRNGKALIYVNATDSNGKAVNWTIGSDDIKARVVEGVKKKMTHPVGAAPAAPVTGPEGAAFGLYPRQRAVPSKVTADTLPTIPDGGYENTPRVVRDALTGR